MEIIGVENYLWILVIHILYSVQMDVNGSAKKLHCGGSGRVDNVRKANIRKVRRMMRT